MRPLALPLCVLLYAGRTLGADFTEIAASDRATVSIEEQAVVRQELPRTLFGFNINHHYFQEDFWQTDRQQVNPKITDALQPFTGSVYRYPGGLVANRFWWEQAVGPPGQRQSQKAVSEDPAGPVLFGVNEYLDFVKSVSGRPLYVLNLVGWHSDAMIDEKPSDELARSNAKLAALIMRHPAAAAVPRYYQLGNELDRSEYQWTYAKYVERARDTIKAVRAVDKDAKFIAFLRDFDWSYTAKAATPGVSRFEDFIPSVLEGLPDVDDFSMHFYYDDLGEIKKAKQISWRLKQFRRAIDLATKDRDRARLGVWITEHARGANLAAGKVASRAELTSNLSAALSTTDFLIALAQIPEVKGACWHGLNAGPWQLFDATIARKDLSPRPVYWAMRVLRTMDLPIVLGTHTQSPNRSGYAGGYDIRSVAFTDAARSRLGLWMVNRSAGTSDVEVSFPSWKGRRVTIQHTYLSGAAGANPEDPNVKMDIQVEPKKTTGAFSDTGVLRLQLPPSSASSFVLQPSK